MCAGADVRTATAAETSARSVATSRARLVTASGISATGRSQGLRKAVNRHAAPFRWQEGYGALTLCDEILPTVIAYVRNQKQHHDHGALDMRFEC
jgi:hypothetical protein